MNVSWPFETCRRWRGDIALMASGALPEAHRSLVVAHLAGCERCRGYHQELRRVAAGLQSLSQSSPEAEPSAALRARWIRAVRTAPRSESVPGGIEAMRAIGRALLQRPVWAGFAAVWLAILFFQVTSPTVAELPSAGSVPAPREIYLAWCDPDWPRTGLVDEAANPGGRESKPLRPKPRSEHRPGLGAA